MLQEVEARRIPIQAVYVGHKAVSPTHRPPLPPGKSLYLLLLSFSRPQRHSAAAWNKSMNNPNDPIGNTTRDLPAQPTAPPHTSQYTGFRMYDCGSTSGRSSSISCTVTGPALSPVACGGPLRGTKRPGRD